ncbi:MAG: HEAT repeat domain-containing protein [Candidatus Hodarchaeales archaeon]|jgi:HEAT repeat protein
MRMSQKEELSRLLEKLEASSSYIRAEAIRQIGRMEIPIMDIPMELHSKLVTALSDPAAEVRAEVVMTLAFLEGEIINPLLEPLLSDPVEIVRSNTISALSYSKAPLSEISSKKLLECMNEKNVQIRDRCARALGRLKVQGAEKILLHTLEYDTSAVVRIGAVVGLGLLDFLDSEVLERLDGHLNRESSELVKQTIVEVISIHSKKKDEPLAGF